MGLLIWILFFKYCQLINFYQSLIAGRFCFDAGRLAVRPANIW
ncbi:Hypothetical protein SCC1_0469 [Pectobacterium versatile]|jgi:hypothetical protein|nr:Hypothetical protein SCC1_0469 [Pectobacterium versatile]MBK4827773.1 hypothetical protein [Pectobacterium carotovorum subsp. carotovorum]PVY73251.1 hypothetical protein C7330_2422 [Pectobacterium versatile]RUR89982.1 hypothetical protein PB16LOC_03628 [Pectobacterium versatile]